MTTPISHSVVINRPISDVFTFVSDFRNDNYWWESAISTEKITPGDVGVGTEFVHYAKILSINTENHLKVLEWNPPHFVKYRNDSPQLPYNLFYRFEAVDGGTRFTLEAHLEMNWLTQLFKPIIMRILYRQLETNFSNLKQHLEGYLQAQSA